MPIHTQREHARKKSQSSDISRRRSESTPDTLLDNFHSGLDIVEDERCHCSGFHSHRRRNTVCCEHPWSMRSRSGVRKKSSTNAWTAVDSTKRDALSRGQHQHHACHLCGRDASPSFPAERLESPVCRHAREDAQEHCNCNFVDRPDKGRDNPFVRVVNKKANTVSDSHNKHFSWKFKKKHPSPQSNLQKHRLVNTELRVTDLEDNYARETRDKHKIGGFGKYSSRSDYEEFEDDDSEIVGRWDNLNENRRQKECDCEESSDTTHAPSTCCSRKYRRCHTHRRMKPTIRTRIDKLAGPSICNHSSHVTKGTHMKGTHHGCSLTDTTYSLTSLLSDEDDVEDEGIFEKDMSDHQKSLMMKSLCEFWRENRLCDVILRVGGQDIPAHRLALAAVSNSFARRYCGEKYGIAPIRIEVPNTSPSGVREVLRFVYTGNLSITCENVHEVVGAAAFLQIRHIIDQCRQLLMRPSVDNVIHFMYLVEKFHLADNLDLFFEFICRHFMRVSQTRGWKMLTFAHVFDLLNEDNLNVERELDIFQAAVAWIEGDKTNRLAFASDLIGCVRFAYITPDQIAKHVESKHFLFEGDDGKELLLCVYRHHALQSCGCRHGQQLHGLPRRKYHSSLLRRNRTANASTRTYHIAHKSPHPENCQNGHSSPIPSRPDVILAVGGINPFLSENEHQAGLIEQFNPCSNHWTTLTRMPEGRHHHTVAVLGGSIYVLGGSVLDEMNPGHLSNPTASCYRYQHLSGRWTSIAPLNVPRMYHAVSVFNGLIFVVAGQTQHSRHLSSVEFYRVDVDEWDSAPDISEARIGIAMATYHGQLFIVGGFSETENEHVVRGTVEVYDHTVRRWSTRSPLPAPRCHAGLAVTSGKLFLVGGSTFPVDSSEVCSLASVLKYDESEDRWDRIQTLRTPRHDFGIAVLGTRIYVVGGVSSIDNKVLADVECLDVDGNYWLDDIDTLENPALGLTCVTVAGDE